MARNPCRVCGSTAPLRNIRRWELAPDDVIYIGECVCGNTEGMEVDPLADTERPTWDEDTDPFDRLVS